MSDDDAAHGLQAHFRGTLIRPGEPEYERARRVFNGMIDKRPALIARCADTEDASAAVNYAREAGLPASVRGGGPGVTGSALCDDGVVIDLSAMKAVQVEPTNWTARAEGGATWGDLDEATQAFGLATTGGVVPSTGIGGLTLGGGLGYLNRKYGLACDNLIGAEVVTADGEVVHAGSEENEDLFWALRGGGGNFGLVTSFDYRLHPVGPVLAGELIFPLDRARDVLRFYRDWSLAAPDEVRADATLLTGPDGPALDVIVCYCGNAAAGEDVVEPMRSHGPILQDSIAPVPYSTVQNLLTPVFQSGLRHYWKSGFMPALSDDAIDAIVDHFAANVPPFFAAIAIEQLGGAISRVDPQATAFSNREFPYSLLVVRMWQDRAEDELNMGWARGVYQAIEPFLSASSYVNYLGEEGEGRVRTAYGSSYDRLAAIKSKYDPDNFFSSNQNIRPA
jgi:FAD/FMN-containing dehydrogenase